MTEELFETANTTTGQEPTQEPTQTTGQTLEAAQPTEPAMETVGAENPVEEFKAPAGASVSQRLLDLLDKDNPFITRAKTSAQQKANASGLQNSTMAVTAGEAAAIDAAAPIAQADAELFTSLYSNDQTAKNQADLYTLQGNISKDLASQQAGFDMQKQEAQNVWEDKFLQDKINLEKLQLDQDSKLAVTDGFNSIQSDFQGDWLEILLNPNFETPEDRDKALNDLVASTESRIQILSATYNVPLQWVGPSLTLEPKEEEEEKVPIWVQNDEKEKPRK
jgi:hypothetical protein